MVKTLNINWHDAIKPLLKKYKNERHPLNYKNRYQLVVMVVLSAQDTDKNINQLAPSLFTAFPNMTALSKASEENLHAYIRKVRGNLKKGQWLLKIAQTLKADENIPVNVDGLTALPGIGRKSANVILRESGLPAEGVIIDLHTVRVAQRLGIATGADPKKIEQQIMDVLSKKQWDAGMNMSFLGREICRPIPKCEECLMKKVCLYYYTVVYPS
ncbi:MAG: endonuclease III [Bacteroidetes bacterium]|nr:endonuclease III [Bacteroidota bacterium]